MNNFGHRTEIVVTKGKLKISVLAIEEDRFASRKENLKAEKSDMKEKQ